MSNDRTILNFPDTAAIEAEAAAWVARFDAGEVSAKDQATFQEWLSRSAFHRQALAEFGSLWAELDTLGQLTNVRKPVDQAAVHGGRAGALASATAWLAACAALVAVGGGIALVYPKALALVDREHGSSVETFYETAVGDRKAITLADGSSVILNTNSRLNVDFSRNRRDVHLLRGEAYFEVIHDKRRPFTVYADDYAVRDIGTAFDVHLSRTGLVEVGVTKGSVELAPANGGASGSLKSLGILVAGHDIVLGQNVPRAGAVATDDLERKLAWREGDLIYTGQPLAEVLSDISRYSNIEIELADPALKNLPVGGEFRIDQIQAILAALENNFGLHAEWIDARHVRFTSRREKPSSKD